MNDSAKVEVLKVWYSVFCTLMDAHKAEHHYAADLPRLSLAGKLAGNRRREVRPILPRPARDSGRYRAMLDVGNGRRTNL